MNDESIVNTSVKYTSDILLEDIKKLKEKYPFIKVGAIGKSVLGKNLWYIKIGEGAEEVFYNASFHANEWITTPVLMKFIEEYAMAIANDTKIYNYNARELYYGKTLYIVPMVNPDGVDLVTGGTKNVDKAYQDAKNIADSFPELSFPDGWKANIRGVDLNLQFPAGWAKARKIKFSQGYNRPAPRDFVGYGPLTEPEALAIYKFTLKHNFKLVIAYHTQGEEIYWNFQNIKPPRGEIIGKKFSEASGYELAEVPYNSSFAGYKDWFIQEYYRPGYTIEAGKGQNPLPLEDFKDIYSSNLGTLVLGLALS